MNPEENAIPVILSDKVVASLTTSQRAIVARHILYTPGASKAAAKFLKVKESSLEEALLKRLSDTAHTEADVKKAMSSSIGYISLEEMFNYLSSDTINLITDEFKSSSHEEFLSYIKNESYFSYILSSYGSCRAQDFDRIDLPEKNISGHAINIANDSDL